MSREKAGAELLGKQNGQQFSLLNLGKAILFFSQREESMRLGGRQGWKTKRCGGNGLTSILVNLTKMYHYFDYTFGWHVKSLGIGIKEP